MAERPRVDVGIPTHGTPRFLREAVESVLAQTYASWTLTVSENGPGSDYVRSIVEPHCSPGRIRYVATGRDLGAARNSSLLVETGSAPYVAILNDDDRWEPYFLERRVDFLEANPDCGLVFSPADFIDSEGRVLCRFDARLQEGVQEPAALMRRLYRENVIPIPSVMVARWAYEAAGAELNEAIVYYDWEMWLRIASRAPVGFLSACDAQYRVHEEQLSQLPMVRLAEGERQLELLDAVEGVLPPNVSRRERRRVRFLALARASHDAYRLGEGRASLTWLGRGARAYPMAILDPMVVRYGVRTAWRSRHRGGGRRIWRPRSSDSAALVPPNPTQGDPPNV